MGWTDLFRSKSSRQQADPRVRWFGKLPSYEDYYSSPTETPWAVEFKDWVLRGFESHQARRANSGGSSAPGSSASALAILQLPNTGMTVLATIDDFGGDSHGRPFPFCFFVGVPSSIWPWPAADSVREGIALLEELATLRNAIQRVPEAKFAMVFGEHTVSLSRLWSPNEDSSWPREAAHLSLADWFAGIAGSNLERNTSEWRGRVLRWRDNLAAAGSKGLCPTPRLPLSAALSLSLQAAGWIEWLEPCFQPKKQQISMIVTDLRPQEPWSLFVVPQEPAPEDFLLTTPLYSTLSRVEDLCRVGESDHSSGTGGIRRSERMAGSWLDFVRTPPASA